MATAAHVRLPTARIRPALLVVVAMFTAAAGMAVTERIARTDRPAKRMSFHNRLLLNRAAVTGLRTVQVMLAVRMHGIERTAARVEQAGGRVSYSAPAVGYLRVELPIEKVVPFVADDTVDAYQIASLSKSGWYRDSEPERDAEGYRGFERTPVRGAPKEPRNLDLPPLTVERSRQPGYTADDDVGLREWFEKHPTFDGRGVTIAILETGTPEFSHPVMRSAKTLDGRDVPKLAGITNSIPADEFDDSRVDLGLDVSAVGTWCRIGDRTYVLPRAGSYRFGLFTLSAAPNLTHRFAVIQDRTTNEVWVDTNGDTDFRGETPVADVNDRTDVRVLKLVHPEPMDLSFVIARGRAPHTVHLYVARGDHQMMTLSVAAGSRTDDGLAYGVAPGARVLLVRGYTSPHRLHGLIEGYLETVARPDVDLLLDATGIFMGPDTAADFVGLLFGRMVAVYGKPIFRGAGNFHLYMNSVSALSTTFSVGGSLGPETFAALYGAGSLGRLMVHSVSAVGPSIDGMIKPDFLAPMHRVAASLWSANHNVRLPKNTPEMHLPAGYQISCCTSASSPYAGGIGALLLSAARQEGVRFSWERFGRGLRVGSRFLDGFPAFQQGNGVLDVNAAWTELRNPVDIPRIHTTARIVHPLAPYSARGPEGAGIFEYEGWKPDTTGRREIRFRRESGPHGPVTYRVSWTGNDGAFAAPGAIVLPLHETVALPVTITARRAGVHSALLNLHDPQTASIVFRTQATIVAPREVDPRTHQIHLSGVVPLMRKNTHYVRIPDRVAALHVELEVIRGTVSATMVQGHSLFPVSSSHLFPQYGRTMPRGKYVALLPHPVAGTWVFHLGNTSARNERDSSLVSTADAEYRLNVRLLHAAMASGAAGTGSASISIANLGAALREPVIETSVATLRTRTGTFRADGLPNQFDIDVPAGTATMDLQLRAEPAAGSGPELHLYDCTTGECFSHDYTLPSSARQRIVVRRPRAGRWVAAVNAAPFPTAASGFVLDEIVAMPGERHSPAVPGPRPPGARWTETVHAAPPPSTPPGATQVLMTELIDAAVQRDEVEYLWENRDIYPHLQQTPAAIATAFHRIELKR